MPRKRLAGDQLAQAVGAARDPRLVGPLEDRARNGGTDPQSVAEFIAYDIPFRTEPAANIYFPPQAQPDDD